MNTAVTGTMSEKAGLEGLIPREYKRSILQKADEK